MKRALIVLMMVAALAMTIHITSASEGNYIVAQHESVLSIYGEDETDIAANDYVTEKSRSFIYTLEQVVRINPGDQDFLWIFFHGVENRRIEVTLGGKTCFVGMPRKDEPGGWVVKFPIYPDKDLLGRISLLKVSYADSDSIIWEGSLTVSEDIPTNKAVDFRAVALDTLPATCSTSISGLTAPNATVSLSLVPFLNGLNESSASQSIFKTTSDSHGQFSFSGLNIDFTEVLRLDVSNGESVWTEYQEVLPFLLAHAKKSGDSMLALSGIGRPGMNFHIRNGDIDIPVYVPENGKWNGVIDFKTEADLLHFEYSGYTLLADMVSDLITTPEATSDSTMTKPDADEIPNEIIASDEIPEPEEPYVLDTTVSPDVTSTPSGRAFGSPIVAQATIEMLPAPQDTFINGNVKTLKFSGSAQPDSDLTLSVGLLKFPVHSGKNGTWEYFIPVTSLQEGIPLTVAIEYSSGEGRGGSLPPFSVDTSCLLVVEGMLYENSIELNGTADANAKLTLVLEEKVIAECSADGDGCWSMVFPDISFTSGQVLTLHAIDSAGNEATKELTVLEYERERIVWETRPPVNSKGIVGGQDKAVWIVGGASPGSIILITAKAASLSDPQRVTAYVGEDGTWSCALILTDVQDAETVTVLAAYADGMSASKAFAAEFCFDTQPPELTLDGEPDASSTQLTGKSEPGAVVRLYLPDLQAPMIAVSDGKGVFSFDALALEEGMVLRLEAEDDVGNVTSAEKVVKAAPPVVYGLLTVDDNPVEGTDVSVSGWLVMSEPGYAYISIYNDSVKIREALMSGLTPLDNADITAHAKSLDEEQKKWLVTGYSFENARIGTGDLKSGEYRLVLTVLNASGSPIGGIASGSMLTIQPKPDLIPQKIFVLSTLFVLMLMLVYWYKCVGKKLRQAENAMIDRINRDSALTIKLRGKTR